MRKGKILLPLLAAGLMVSVIAAGQVNADEHGGRHEDQESHENHEHRGGRAASAVPENAAYRQECSSCHFLYPPMLLPERSWKQIMNDAGKHFGENLALDEKSAAEITKFLMANSAEKSNTEAGRKITRSAGSGTPSRILDVPYIKKEHRKIKAEVFKRPSIGSPSNCGACHPDAAKGDFEEDAVKIPGN